MPEAIVGTNSVAVNGVEPSDLKTALLKVMVANVLSAFTANAVDMLGGVASKVIPATETCVAALPAASVLLNVIV